MFYRIMSAPPGYVAPQNFMVAEYLTIEFPSQVRGLTRADGTWFFKTVEEARQAIPHDAVKLPFVPEYQFLELWELSERAT